jgi:hypothetical protein
MYSMQFMQDRIPRTLRNRANGNCLYDSLAQALESDDPADQSLDERASVLRLAINEHGRSLPQNSVVTGVRGRLLQRQVSSLSVGGEMSVLTRLSLIGRDRKATCRPFWT